MKISTASQGKTSATTVAIALGDRSDKE